MCAVHGLSPIVHTQQLVNRPKVSFDGTFCDADIPRNDLVWFTLQQASQDSQLASTELACQRVPRCFACALTMQGLRWQVNTVCHDQLNGLLGDRYVGALGDESTGTTMNGLRNGLRIIVT